ncbi:FAD/NAD(P)-binding domain-containing protein [Coniophora puteana RWD-64-598 SS2]|uniref:FAD/NAD(P)-binding domain-containing protein n=1 Tax=Coniophora puteana (strain RWD-64-598) TaxID=741705 RepID=A0A5M3N6G8_CONPW|nr:FAD/NAD(P)-binding domain-containing protein [Coniophora puteana RWD-64-598 SS2]EIW87029.1 FAD/NAD(P)-binding domain-containing protein [Coniophora puteana RWD-64-598 SS2]
MVASKNVVIVGAGFAGTAIAQALSKKLDNNQYHLILLNARSYAVDTVATARLTVDTTEKLEDRAFVKLDRIFQKQPGEIKVGIVTSIEKTETGAGGVLVLRSGERVPYEVLVLASGSLWDGPLGIPEDEEDVPNHLASWRAKYSTAKHVVLVGGGAVGIEIAGELKDTYPDKKVTIIQRGEKLFRDIYSDKFRNGMESRLTARGVNVILNDSIDELPAEGAAGITTRGGRQLPDADLVLFARGPRPNTDFIASLGGDILNNQGYVKVKPTLQLSGHDNVFAAGDIIEWKEQKQAAKTGSHAAIVAANVLSLLGGSTSALKSYKGSPELILVTNGRNGGMAYFSFFGGITLGDWFARLLKSKTLMIPMFRKGYGYN